jgi:hypothetical protein
LCLLAGCALLAASCGDGGVKTYPVKGNVLYKGEPAAGAEVTFIVKGTRPGAMDAVYPNAVVQEDGTFTVRTRDKDGKEKKGAPAGSYNITVRWLREVDADGQPTKMSGGIYPDYLKNAYSDLNNPAFTAEVKEESNELAPFELQDVKAKGGSKGGDIRK